MCDNLKAYLDGELRFSDRLAMLVHLKLCAECRRNAAEWPRLSREIERLEGEPVPPTLRDKLMADAMTASSSARSHGPTLAPERPRAQGVWTMRRASLAAAFAVVMVAVGLLLIPRQEQRLIRGDVITGMAEAMETSTGVYFTGWSLDERGGKHKLEGWVKGPNKIRIRVDGREDIADNGEKLVAVELGRLPKVTVRASGRLPGLATGMTYLDLLGGPDALKSSLTANDAKVVNTGETTLPDGRKGIMTELSGLGGARMRIVTDEKSNRLIQAETYTGRRLTERIERVRYDVSIPDSVFSVNVPDDLPVIEMVTPRSEGDRKAEIDRLFRTGGAHCVGRFDKGSCGAYFHPDFRFEALGTAGTAMFYVPDRNVYRIIGRVRIYRVNWVGLTTYERIVEDADVRLPGEPVIEDMIVQDVRPGEYRELPTLHCDPAYRLLNVGTGLLTVTYHRIKRAFVIRGTAKLIPTGEVYSNEVARHLGRDCDIVSYVRSGGKLDFGGLPENEVESIKADVDVTLRLYEILSHKNSEGHVVINGGEVRGQYGRDSSAHGLRFLPAGPSRQIWALEVPSRKEFYLVGRVKIMPGGKIVKNGVVDYDGNVLSSEE